MKKASPWRVLLPTAVGTCFSLFGDASLYTVLPTHTTAVGVSVASVGVLLSVNRFIRLILNGPVGMAYDRWRHRPLFLSALFVGALSTAMYGLTRGFWPLLLGRLLWGLAWAGIWVGGNTIVLDISSDETRGRWVGLYQVSFFLGASGGALLGGFLTDGLGYHRTMLINAALTLLGAVCALVLLPETHGLKRDTVGGPVDTDRLLPVSNGVRGAGFVPAAALYAVNRLLQAGFLYSTLGLFLLAQMGRQVRIAGFSLGVATLTGLGLGLFRLISMISSPLMGGLSDRVGNRWMVVAGGLLPGIIGFVLLAVGLPMATLFGVFLTAIAGGSNQGLSTALIGDLGNGGRRGRRLGALFTIGDLASAVGPLLAYALMPLIGLENIYWLGAGLFASMFLIALGMGGGLICRPSSAEEKA